MDVNGIKDNFYSDMKYINVDEDYLNVVHEKADGQGGNFMPPKGGEPPKWKKPPKDHKPNYKKLSKLVAMVALILVTSTGIAIHISGQNASADKDPTPNENAVQADNEKLAIGTDTGNSEENAGTSELIFTNWEGVLSAKENFKELIIPSVIPEGYNFQSLTVENHPNGAVFAEYLFEAEGEKTLIISQFVLAKGNTPAKIVSDYTEKFTVAGREVFVTKADIEVAVSGTFYVDTGKVALSGNITTEELKEIVSGIEE